MSRSHARDRSRPSGGAPQSALAMSAPFANWTVSQASVSGGVIDSVPDSRGGRTITGTGTERPAYSATDANFNNRASATGDTSDDRLITSAGTLTDWKFLHDGTGFELMIVMRAAASAAVRPHITTQGNSTNNVGMMLTVTSAGNLQAIVGHGGGGILVSAVAAIGAGQTRVIGMRYKESSSPKLELYANGSSLGSNSTWAGPSSSNPTRALAVGNWRDTFSESTGAPWAEFVVWNRELTTTERAAITAELAAKYGAV